MTPRPPLAALEDCIENERMRLMKAYSVLRCLCMAVETGDHPDDGEPRPYFPDLIKIGNGLVNQAIRELDSIKLGRILVRLRAPGSRRH